MKLSPYRWGEGLESGSLCMEMCDNNQVYQPRKNFLILNCLSLVIEHILINIYNLVKKI